MREQGMTDCWFAGNASNIGDTSNFTQSALPQNPNSQRAANSDSSSEQQKSLDTDAAPAVDLSLPYQSRSSSFSPQSVAEGSSVVPPESASTPSNPYQRTDQPIPPKRKWLKWTRNWLTWTVLAGLISGGAGLIGVAMLLKLPAAPNCPAIFWPLASASVRLHCAQVAANKQTVQDLLEAIALVEVLPNSHPLRPEIDRLLQEWSLDILALGEEAFQAGKLEEAIAISRKIPPNIASGQVKAQVSRWESIWSEAQAIYQKAEAELPKQNWHQAFMAAVALLNIDNDYWATTKYEQLNNRIETARQDGNKLAQAQDLAQRGSVDNLLAAIKLLESIGTNSYIYQKAQQAIPEFGQKILELAQKQLDRRDANEAIAIANQIPAITNLQSEAQDFITVAEAWRSAWNGTIPDLEAAIAYAQKINSDRPLYNKAQELITRWQLEIEDITHLERSRQLAQAGNVGDLTAAIAEAKLIPDSNPRSSEARQEVNRWSEQIEKIEDRPYLDRAEELASLADITSLQAAINEASQIPRGRALYRKAQSRIATWTAQIQRIEDQPYLDQARSIASSGDLPAAIRTAQQITRGRSLYREARAAINDWEGQIQARVNWQQARQIALTGTSDALIQAIRLADQVPTTSPLRVDVNPVIDQWSQQLFSIALDRGESDIPAGIAIARQIPRSTSAYKVAQEQIAIWQKFLNPEPAEPTRVGSEE